LNDTGTEYYLGGAALANFLGTGGLPPCNLLQEALRQSTAQWAVIMLGHNDCMRLHHTRAAILNDFTALIQTVISQGRIPLVISEWFIDRVPPLDGYPGPENDPCPDDVNDNMYWIRGKMKDYCSQEGIPFLDLSDHIFSEFSQAYSTQPINWKLVDQQMKHNWVEVYLRNGETGDGIHPEENARHLGYSIIGPWLNTVLDLDFDDVGDIPDNCPAVPNSDQIDTDGDCRGDACDAFPDDYDTSQPDADRDGIGDTCDNCVHDANHSQEDADNDGLGDVCDTDPLPCLAEELYGDAPETIHLLRTLRDEVLSTTPEGQALIGLYYALSPELCRAVEEDEVYRIQMKKIIDTFVLILRQARSGFPHLL
jgi:lysophospholipase L1-like esterase